jgi:hypothetical protein
MTRRGERGVWQRRYWEHTIRDQRDFAAHTDYIHFNPAPTFPPPQAGEGWGGGAPGGLAIFVFSPMRRERPVSRRMDRRR